MCAPSTKPNAWFSGYLGEARQGVLSAVVKSSKTTTIVSLFIDFQVRSQKQFGRELLDGKANCVCCLVKSHIFYDTRFRPGVLARKKLSRCLIIKSFVRLFGHNHWYLFFCSGALIKQISSRDTCSRSISRRRNCNQNPHHGDMVLNRRNIKARRRSSTVKSASLIYQYSVQSGVVRIARRQGPQIFPTCA